MANSYKFNHSINDTYEVSCEMERKRVECAIMIKAALADAERTVTEKRIEHKERYMSGRNKTSA